MVAELGEPGVSRLATLAPELLDMSSGELGALEGFETALSNSLLACWMRS